MLYLETITKLLHHFIIQVGYIICDNFVRNPMSANDFSLDKLSDCLLCYICIGSNFNSLGEVVDEN